VGVGVGVRVAVAAHVLYVDHLAQKCKQK
jgi:hypothetical protein